MAVRYMRNFNKSIVYLAMVIILSSNTEGESAINSNPNLISTTQSSTSRKIIPVKDENKIFNKLLDSLLEPKTNNSVQTQIKIRKTPMMNSTCRMIEKNGNYTTEIRNNRCQIIVDKMDKYSEAMLNYLELLCQQDEKNEITEKSGNEKLYECVLEKENDYKYVITSRNWMGYENKSINELCEDLRSIKSSGIHNKVRTSYCISLSEYYIAYDNEKCCLGSFNFIPGDAFQTELLLIWIEGDCIAYIIGPLYFLSFICLCIIFASGIFSKRYRSERGNQILIHFAFSIFVQFILHNISCIINRTPLYCKIHTIMFHYFTLVESCWTSIIAYLQFKRFVKVFDNEPNHLILKLCAIAYVFPIIPITLWFFYHRQSIEFSNYLTFGLPELFILLINSTFLILITRNIVFVKNEYIEHRKSLTMEVKLIFFLFFVLDFSWFDVILAHLTAYKFFIYLFLLTQSMQGFMLFFVFGIMNDHNRLIYKKFLFVYTKKILRTK